MEVTLASASERQKWISTYFKEYVREAKFAPYMGKDASNIIVVKYEMQQESGKTINIPLITRLKSSGVTGSQILDGNEEELGNFNFPVTIDWRRNGVRVPKSTSYKTDIDLFNAAKSMLKTWEAEKMRDDVIDALYSVQNAATDTTNILYGLRTIDTVGSGVQYAQADYIATAANKNAWLALNSDRVLFGVLRSNNAANVHATSLANVDSVNDKLTPAVGELAKRMAKQADPHIRPYKTKSGAEWFVMFCNSRCFRDLANDTGMVSANRDGRPREGDSMNQNPLFVDGDLLKNGIIYREIEELPTLTGVGNTSIDISGNFLCGAQAVAIAWGQEPTPRQDMVKDYGFRPGVAIEELVGVKKVFFNGKQQGMVTVYAAAVADA